MLGQHLHRFYGHQHGRAEQHAIRGQRKEEMRRKAEISYLI
jgi:hypothetical protein